MNGYLNTNYVKFVVGTLFEAETDEMIHISRVTDIVSVACNQLVNMADADIDVIAYEVVTNPQFSDHKIQAIKEVRTRTGAGLREVKQAVERAIVRELRAKLADAERVVSGHYVD